MKTICRFRLVPLLLSIIFTAICFVNLAGKSLPYQDPTPELLDKQIADIHLLEMLIVIGFCATIIFIVLFIYLRRYKNKHLS